MTSGSPGKQTKQVELCKWGKKKGYQQQTLFGQPVGMEVTLTLGDHFK